MWVWGGDGAANGVGVVGFLVLGIWVGRLVSVLFFVGWG